VRIGFQEKTIDRISRLQYDEAENTTDKNCLMPRTARPSHLPDFENPPVTEVVLSIQFERLRFGIRDIGLLWREFRSAFPGFEERPPLQAVFERFEPGALSAPEVRFELVDKPPMPRIWFLNEAGTVLIQIQPDRFIHNWRQVQPGDTYPRYERVRDSFVQEVGVFQSFVNKEDLGELVINQCEVTYVNHIVAGEGWERPGQLGRILRQWCDLPPDGTLPEPEGATLEVHYIMRDAAGGPIGRLHARLEPAIRASDKRPLYVLNLTARGIPQGEGIEGALRFLDLGREWIVRGFAAMTTFEMHEIWRRTDG